MTEYLTYCSIIKAWVLSSSKLGSPSLNNWLGVLVAGTGMPDYPTECPRMIIVALVDGGPAGLISMLTLRQGTKGSLHENMTAGRVQWAGMLPTQIEYLQRIGLPTVEFTSHDYKLLASLQVRSDIPPVWQKQLVRMSELHQRLAL
ncbi:hypothetical protein B0H14DRAFT_2642703 [Mycena olivaceomarginata]|nr:hypothetical protein B0H14DRAFT_2642703 [Mycena olivaceomarginata]